MKYSIRAITAVLIFIIIIALTASCTAETSDPDLLSLSKDNQNVTEGETTTNRFSSVTKEITEAPVTTKKSENESAEKPDKSETTAPPVITKEGQTAPPVITNTTHTAPNIFCIAGTCEENAKIYIKGGITDVSYIADNKYFIGTVEIAKSGTTPIEISAIVVGKTESTSVKINAAYKASATQVRNDAFEVVVGSNYQCHFVSSLPDYLGTNLLTDSQKEKVESNVKKNVQWLQSNMEGAELIYLVIPNPMTVYPETVPSNYVQLTSENRTQQFIKAAENGGAKIIDLTEKFIEHKSDTLKIFHKTDSHWTEYGAWLAYTELMNYISQKYPSATPRTYEEMGFYTKDVRGGDMAYYLEFNENTMRELAVFADPKFDSPAKMLFFNNKDWLLMNHDTTPKAATYNTGNTSLPNIYVMRDSFGIAIYNMLPERFNKTVYREMWSYGFDQASIKSSGANYVLYVVAERTIGDLIY